MKSKGKSEKLVENLGSSKINKGDHTTVLHTNREHVCKRENSMQEDGGYHCGACSHQFETICQLHTHLQGSHTSRGCYHYDSKLRTAFPKYDAVCCFTQTSSPEESKSRTRKQYSRQIQKHGMVNRKGRSRISRHGTEDSIKSAKSYDISTNNLEVTEPLLQNIDLVSSIGNTHSISSDMKEASSAQYSVLEQRTQIKEILMPFDSVKPECTTFESIPSKKHQKPAKSKGKIKSVKTLPSAKKSGKAKLSGVKSTLKDSPSRSPFRKKSKAKDSLLETQPSPMQINNTVVGSNCSQETLPKEQAQSYSAENKQLNNMLFNCGFCSIKFANQGDLDKHNHTEHSSSNCDKITNEGQQAISAYMNIIKTDDEGGKSTKRNNESKSPYTCKICGHVMPWNKKEVHERLHSGERPYICEQCGKGLISKNKLKRHMLTHSDDKKHKCEICGVGFQMKYKLRMHMHIHTGKKPYLCSICGAEFNHSSNLATHTRCVHLQIKPHECSVCGGKYAKKSQLDDHMLSHSTEKQFTCRFCGKSFKYQKGMKRHEKTHEDDESLRCGKCEAQFVHKSDFLHHISIAHKAGPLRCTKCDKVFSNKDELKEHKATECDKKKYQCCICSEYYKVCNQYFTHMLAAHGIEREQAKLLHTQHKQRKITEQVCETSVNSILYSPINVPNLNTSDTEIVRNSKSEPAPSFNVRQMVTGLLDENKSTLSALTRVATENLRLHSQDIQEEEKLNSMIIPSLNPSIMLCRNVDGSFVRSNIITAGNTTNTIADVGNTIQLANNLNGNIQPENSPYLPATRDGLFLEDRNLNRTSLLNMVGSVGVNQTGEFIGGSVGDRSQSLNTISMIPISTSICSGQVALLEHESTLALRRLAQNADNQDVSQSILAGSNSNPPIQDLRNQQQAPAVGFSIQNLF